MPAGFPTWITESDAVSAVTELTIIQKTTFTALEHHWTLLGVFPPCGHPGFRRLTRLRISQKVVLYWQLGDILSLNSVAMPSSFETEGWQCYSERERKIMNNDCFSRQENYAEKVFAWPLESISGPSLPGQRWHTQWPLGTGARVIVKCICSYCTFSTLWNVFVCWRTKWALRELVHPISNYPPTTLSRRTWDMFQRKNDLLKLRLAAWFLILRIQFKTVLVLFPSPQ